MTKTLKNVFWGMIFVLILGATFCIPNFCGTLNRVFAEGEIVLKSCGWTNNGDGSYKSSQSASGLSMLGSSS